jgi:hypothetical protein
MTIKRAKCPLKNPLHSCDERRFIRETYITGLSEGSKQSGVGAPLKCFVSFFITQGSAKDRLERNPQLP